MYRHLLIATDGSELAGKAVTQGLALAKALGARVTAVTVTEPLTALVTGEASVALDLQGYEQALASDAAWRHKTPILLWESSSAITSRSISYSPT